MNIDPTKRCQVYRNLHKNCFSIRQGGLVVGHAEKIILRDCRFLVQPAGREKVLRTKVKNVHAVISGYMSSFRESNALADSSQSVVTYNPYKFDTFVEEDSLNPILTSDFVDMDINDSWKQFVLAIWKKKNEV